MLGKTVGEINQMDVREYMGWMAWLKLKEERNGKRRPV
jgi:hypothetical protein